VRREYKYYEQRDFRGGINQEPENARYNQVLDARNVWCPEGTLEQRPGFLGISNYYPSTDSNAAGKIVIKEDVSLGTFTDYSAGTADFSDVEVGDRWYVGSTEDMRSTDDIKTTAVKYTPATANSADVSFKCEYWNGSAWTYLPAQEYVDSGAITASGTYTAIDPFFGSTSATTISFACPLDWASTTVNSQTKWFLRFTLVDDGFDTDGDVTATFASFEFYQSDLVNNASSATNRLVGAVEAQFPGRKLYVIVRVHGQSNSLFIHRLDSPHVSAGCRTYESIRDTGARVAVPSFAVVNEFAECYMAYSGNIHVITEDTVSSSNTLATVETSENLVGTNASFNPDWIAQLSSFPRANIITFFNGQLWAAGLVGEPSTVRWSAKIPAHRVWPTVSFEPIIEDDNSEITAMSSIHEQLIVFKRDSIWKMVYNGKETDTGLDSYTPVKDVSGIGCISHATVARIPDGLVFMSEEGIYLYNGTSTVIKISGAIDPFFKKITSNASGVAVATHWRSKNCYMLAVPANGSPTNNFVLVYDYKHKQQSEDQRWVGSWWIWDNIEAASWLLSEDQDDKQVLYYINGEFELMQLGPRDHDHGTAITSYVETNRFGFGEFVSKRARELRVNANNKTASLDVQVKPDDKDFDSSGDTLSFADPSGVEASITGFGFGVAGELVPKTRRESRISIREDGEWFRVKIKNTTKNQKMELHSIALGTVPLGRR